MWFSVGCPLQTVIRLALPSHGGAPYSVYIRAGIGSPSGVRSVSSRCSACLSFGLKTRIPSRINVDRPARPSWNYIFAPLFVDADLCGDPKAWSVVRLASVAEEDARGLTARPNRYNSY
jgi:hypothetical protein